MKLMKPVVLRLSIRMILSYLDDMLIMLGDPRGGIKAFGYSPGTFSGSGSCDDDSTPRGQIA